MVKAPPSIDFYPDDWLGGTDELSDAAYRAYMRLLIYQWTNGHLPVSDTTRQNLCRFRDLADWVSVWSELSGKFCEISAGEICFSLEAKPDAVVLINQKLHEQREKRLPQYQAQRERARENGKKGGRPKNQDRYQGGFEKKPTVGGGSKEEGVIKRELQASTSSVGTNIASDSEKPTETELIAAWNATPGVVQARGGVMLSATRRDAFLFCLGFPGWWDDFREALSKFPLKCANRPDGWKPGIDWILNRDNLVKVLEGQYDWAPGSKSVENGDDGFNAKMDALFGDSNHE